MDEAVGFQESGISLPIKVGRVDLSATLQDTVQQYKASTRVGFYCGGKQPCMHDGAQKVCLPFAACPVCSFANCQRPLSQHALRTHQQVAKGLEAQHARLTNIV